MLTGSGNDTEDGSLTGSALVWTSSRDGSLGTGESVTAILSVGVHDITLTATDSGGKQASKQIRLIVNGRSALTRMDASPSTTNTGNPVTYSWTIGDPEGDILTCRLDVDGDGTDDYTITDCGNTTSQVHTFAVAGNYTAHLAYDDGINAPQETAVSVMINTPQPGNTAPVVNAFTAGQTSVTAGTSVTFAWNVSDADNDTLMCMLDVDGDAVADYTINDCPNNTSQSHVYATAGSANATLTVTDGVVTTRSSVVAITVTAANPAPVINNFAADSTSVAAGDTVTFTWNVSDAENDTLICSLDVDGDATADYTINDCANNNSQSHVYTVVGDTSAVLTVTDGINTVSTLPVTISVNGNSAPVINNFAGNRAAVATGAAVVFSWNVTDADGDSLTCELDIDDDGTVEYTISDCAASSSQTHVYVVAGDFTARLTVSDGFNTPVSQVFNVAASNLPVIQSFDASPAPYYADVATTFRWQVSDPDGDVLTCMLDADGDGVTDYPINDCGNIATQEHVFTRTQTFDATLTVTNGINGNIVRTFTLDVDPSLVATLQSSAPAVANGRVFYTITVGNVAQVPRQNVQVYLDIPDGLSFHRNNDAIPDLYECTSGVVCSGGATAQWWIGDLPAGETRTLTTNAAVAPTVVVAGNVLTMRLRMTSTEMAGEIVKTHDVVVSTAAVSQLSVGATPEPVMPGSDVTVTVDAGNIGSAALGNTEMRLRVPAGMTVVSISDGGTEDTATGELVWTLGSVPVGGSVHREAVLTVATDARPGEAIALHAELTHDGGAAVDVVAEHMVTVTAGIPLLVTVNLSPEPVTAGNVVTYTIRVLNTSLLPVDGINVYMRMPDGVSFDNRTDATPSAYSCTSGWICGDGAEAYWYFSTLAANTAQDITVNATVSAAQPPGSLLPTNVQVDATGFEDEVLVRISGRVQ